LTDQYQAERGIPAYMIAAFSNIVMMSVMIVTQMWFLYGKIDYRCHFFLFARVIHDV